MIRVLTIPLAAAADRIQLPGGGSVLAVLDSDGPFEVALEAAGASWPLETRGDKLVARQPVPMLFYSVLTTTPGGFARLLVSDEIQMIFAPVSWPVMLARGTPGSKLLAHYHKNYGAASPLPFATADWATHPGDGQTIAMQGDGSLGIGWTNSAPQNNPRLIKNTTVAARSKRMVKAGRNTSSVVGANNTRVCAHITDMTPAAEDAIQVFSHINLANGNGHLIEAINGANTLLDNQIPVPDKLPNVVYDFTLCVDGLACRARDHHAARTYDWVNATTHNQGTAGVGHGVGANNGVHQITHWIDCPDWMIRVTGLPSGWQGELRKADDTVLIPAAVETGGTVELDTINLLVLDLWAAKKLVVLDDLSVDRFAYIAAGTEIIEPGETYVAT